MAKTFNVYVKKRLRLDLLSVPQREMYQLGEVARSSILKRISSARGPNDLPAAPLKSESWKRIKKSKGLRPIRDLKGTGMIWPEKGGKRKPRLKKVGHLLDQILVRRVGDNMVKITEPTTRAGRIKARAHRAMFMFSPRDKATVIIAANSILRTLKNRVVKSFSSGQ